MTVVLDAGAAVELILDRPVGRVVRERLTDHAGDVHAPHLIDLEVASAVRKLVLREYVDPDRATTALRRMASLPLDRHQHLPLLARVWDLRGVCTPYDAGYLALAEVLGGASVDLVTTDARFARAIERNSDVRAVLV
ncbi:MAG: type II toxin-antitoxin system VapC family toxin [Solirubrobacteraceae bacterium]|nr:type II toxin-antitoxin system VapC family toxin [Solirubrobacteraceae bacterium]